MQVVLHLEADRCAGGGGGEGEAAGIFKTLYGVPGESYGTVLFYDDGVPFDRYSTELCFPVVGFWCRLSDRLYQFRIEAELFHPANQVEHRIGCGHYLDGPADDCHRFPLSYGCALLFISPRLASPRLALSRRNNINRYKVGLS